MVLKGTICMKFRGDYYHTPVEIFVPIMYPIVPPIVYVRPSQDMLIKRGHKHVDTEGMVYLPYLHEWRPNTHTILDLCTSMSKVFGMDPPLYQRVDSYVPSNSFKANTPSFNYGVNRFSYKNDFIAKSSNDGAKKEWKPPENINFRKNVNESDELREKIKAQLQKALKKRFTDLAEEIDSQIDILNSLNSNKSAMEGKKVKLEEQKKTVEGLLISSKEKFNELEEYSIQLEGKCQEKSDPEDYIQPNDLLSKQLLSLVAENMAIEDALYSLDQALVNCSISSEEFLNEVRKLTRKQFAARALENKVLLAQKQKFDNKSASLAKCLSQESERSGFYKRKGGYKPNYTKFHTVSK